MELPEELPAVLGGCPEFSEEERPVWPPRIPAVQEALARALADGSWGQYRGPHVESLESSLAAMWDVPRALTCASGTLAVEVALRAAGVGAGDEVLLSAYDYESNFLSVHAIGAFPVLVDLAEANWQIDPAVITAAITPQTRAVVASHLHGGIAPMQELQEIARREELVLIEDAAQAAGGELAGRQLGSWGEIGTLSFGGSKLLTAGRGGAVLFQHERHYHRARQWLNRGVQAWAPLSEIQALVLQPQLDQLGAQTQYRWQWVQRFQQSLTDLGVPGLRLLAGMNDAAIPAFYKIGLQYDPQVWGLSRTQFLHAVQKEGLPCDAGFRAFHLGRSPSRYRHVGSLPHAEKASANCIIFHHTIMYHGLGVAERVARALAKVYRNADRVRAALV